MKSSWLRADPKSSDWFPNKKGGHTRCGEGLGKTETTIGVMQIQAQEQQGLVGATRKRQGRARP